MRVINTASFEMKSDMGDAKLREEGYAVLSHRWVGPETTFHQYEKHVAELKSGSTALSPQLERIHGACICARNKGIEWLWIDSCCINKLSAVEETESINSMYRWYRHSVLCITYLYDVELDDTLEPTDPRIFNNSGGKPAEWFSRGWTLQELLASGKMEFYDKNWKSMGTKRDMKASLSKLTGIDENYLTGAEDFRNACVATKMSWMAKRTTTREEDIAYSMVGLFGVTISPVYGEGPRAFMRLQEVTLSSSSMDESLFAWKMPALNAGRQYNRQSSWKEDEWGLLAPSPAWFAASGSVRAMPNPISRRDAFKVTGDGVTAPVGRAATDPSVRTWHFIAMSGCAAGCIPGIPAIMYLKHIVKKVLNADATFGLQCFEVGRDGRQKPVGIYLRPVRQVESDSIRSRFPWLPVSGPYKRIRCTEFGLKPEEFSSAPGLVVQPVPANV